MHQPNHHEYHHQPQMPGYPRPQYYTPNNIYLDPNQQPHAPTFNSYFNEERYLSAHGHSHGPVPPPTPHLYCHPGHEQSRHYGPNPGSQMSLSRARAVHCSSPDIYGLCNGNYNTSPPEYVEKQTPKWHNTVDKMSSSPPLTQSQLMMDLQKAREYMMTLPTKEEYDNMKEKYESSRAKNFSLSQRIKAQDDCIRDLNESIANKDSALDMMEEKNTQLQLKLQSFEIKDTFIDASVVDERDMLLNQLRKSKDKEQSYIEMEKKYKEDSNNFSKKCIELEEYLTERETTICGLKAELALANTRLNRGQSKLKVNSDEITFLQTQVECYAAELKRNEEKHLLVAKLMLEFSSCLAQIQSIKTLLEDHLNDGSPDLSCLLDFQNLNLSNLPKMSTTTLNTNIFFEEQIEEIKKIKFELCELQSKMSDIYAGKIAANVQCQTQ